MGDRTRVWLARHGATEWSESGQHTSVTDLPLLAKGREDAKRVGAALAGREFGLVLSSPRRRAAETAQIAGFTPELDEDLVEWAYGPGEGLTSPQIREKIPGWRIWSHGAPQFERDGYEPGETQAHIATRLERAVERIRASGPEDAIVFAHGHSLRAFTMVWLGLPIGMGKHFPLETGTLSLLGYEKENAAIIRWNAEV